MPDLTLLTKDDLASIGLSGPDLKAFVDMRVRFGAIDTGVAAQRVAKALSTNGEKKWKTHVKAQGMMATQPGRGLNQVLLRLSPTPPMMAQSGAKVIVSFRRQVDPEDFAVTLDFTLGGVNEIRLHDVSFEHLIHYRVETSAGDLVAERVLTPVHEQRGELFADFWTATPQLGNGEELKSTATTLGGKLKIDTLRPGAAPGKPAKVAALFARKGRFEVIGQPSFGFGGYGLSVALATPDLLTRIAATLDTAGGTVAAQARFALGDARFAGLAGSLPLVAGELDFGGTFRTRQEGGTYDRVAGWVWVLTGPDVMAGFRPDPAPVNPAPDALIFLPGDLAQMPETGLPQDVTEATLLARPDLFSDDPGSTCKPFNNPGRILGEKRFRTVLRVTQPQHALAGLKPIRFEDQDKRPVDFPRLAVDPGNPVDYEGDPARFQAQSVALGHVIEHVVRYRSNGYSLGNVAHSLTLAPREKRRIMKVDFARSERASRQEATSADDSVMDSLDSRRDYDEAVTGELGEWSRGSSEASAVGAAGGAGGLIPGAPVVIGGGISGGASQASSSQSSHRETAVRETQRLRDAIRRYGESLRNLESTVVTEVAQSESVTGVSEVVQNINYTRALSVVYYEILRHLRVDTEIGSVSECIFVPMPIRPFTSARISRHRKVLARFARGWLDKAVFRYLDDIQANFVGSEVPGGERADHPLTRLSGSLTMTMGINMPVGGAEAASSGGDSDTALHQTATQLETAWNPYATLLPMPVPVLARAIAEQRGRPAETEKLFRTKVAPAMARALLERLTLSGTRAVAPVDFTLATSYKRGQPLRVDFDVMVDGTLTRRNLERLTLRLDPNFDLPPGSWLNLTGAAITFATEHNQGRAAMRGGTRDLLDITTGGPDNSGALINFPLTSDDRMNLRDRLREGYSDLLKTLEANTFRYHKAIWRSIDADELYALLDGYAISPSDGRSLASMVERRPIGILGNSLVFAARTDWPLDPMYASFDALKANYVSGLPPADPIRVSLPTSGLYARAHMDDCIAAEEHNGSFDWVFDNAEPELADFPAGLFDSRRSEPQGLAPTPLPGTIINLQNAPTAPAPEGLASTLTALGNANSFRDMTGLAGTQKSLDAAISNATGLATSMGQAAVAAQAAQLASDARAGKDLTTFAAATQKAVDRGQISPKAAQAAVEDMAARKGSGSGQGGGGDDLHKAVLTGGAAASHSSVDKDGTTKTTTKQTTPARPRDVVADVSVVPIPGTNQVLFMNFVTGRAELLPEHVRFLELLAGEIGVSIEDVEMIEGHASTAGSDEDNEKLGLDRAMTLFNRLHALVTPLGASPDYSPAFVSTAGESGSYRARFAHIDAIANAKGKGDPNDPVEKAVLFTLKPGTSVTLQPRNFDFGGVKLTVINNYIYIAGTILCSLPGGPVKEIDRSTVKVLSENVVNTEIRTGDTNLSVDVGPVTVSPTVSPTVNISLNLLSGNSLLNGLSMVFGRDPVTGFIADPVVTPPISQQLHDAWKIKLFAPKIVNARSMADILASVAGFALDFARSGATLPAGAPQKLVKILTDAATILADASATDKKGNLVDKIVDTLGLGPVKTLLGMMRFGHIVMDAQIKVKADDEVMINGRFAATGLLFGTDPAPSPGAGDRLPVLNNAEYTTSRKLKLGDWENQGNFSEFSYLDSGILSAGLAANQAMVQLAAALSELVTNVLPGLLGTITDTAAQGLFDVVGKLEGVVRHYGPNAALRFKAFDTDTGGQISSSSVTASGAELRMIAMTPNAITFTKDK